MCAPSIASSRRATGEYHPRVARSLLVLGASGFLGPHQVAAARAAGWRVSVGSRAPESAPGVEPDERYRFDAEAPGALALLFARARPSAVLLASAAARVEACEREPARAAHLNAELPGEAARLAAALGLRFVHVSTDLVFGGSPPRPAGYAEDDAPEPRHVYGRTKAAGEARVLAADPSALVVRLPLLYGDSFGRGLGASDALLAARARGETPALFVDEWRTPLEVANAARALLELVGGTSSGRLHVAGPERLSRLELGRIVLAARGLEPKVRAATRAELGLEGRPADVALDAARARALLATPLLAPRSALGAGGALP
jgi:dTDP-4-dehydrorhamnose reductase